MHSAQIRFDDRGIPYIEASSDRDLWLVEGYMHASDRMFQMDMLRRAARGEMADLFGESCVSDDKLMRTIGIKRIAEDELKRLSQDVRAYLDAYAMGVNEYLRSNVKSLPFEYTILTSRPEPWKPVDTLCVLKYLQFESDESWRLDDLRQRIVDKQGDKVASDIFEEPLKSAIVSYDTTLPSSPYRKALACVDPRIGSNVFAVGGAMSDTRGSLMACDKHAPFSVPDRFYNLSLSTPQLHLVGATIPGVPGILVGRNEHISFGSINLKADTQDLILEEFSPQFPNKYRTADGWQNVSEIIEEIPVRFKKNLLHKVLITKQGPILSKNETSGVAFNWTGARKTKPVLETLWKMNKAQDMASFAAALDEYQGNPQTFVFTDRKGGISIKAAGAVPDRRTFGGGSLLVPGWAVKQEPLLMKPQELPNEVNSKETFVIAGDQRIAGHPNILSPYQPMRVRQILSNYKRNGQRAGMPELALLQSDQMAPLLTLVKTELKRATDKTELIDKTQLTAIDQLNAWDGQLTTGSVPATIYESFIETLAHRLLEPKLGPDAATEYLDRWPRWTVFVERVLRNHPNEWLPPGERSYDAFLISTFGMALKGVRVSAEKEDAKSVDWGTLHKATFRHPICKYVPSLEKLAFLLEIGPTSVGGDQNTINASNVKASKDSWNFASAIGPTMRLLTDMADNDKLYANLSLGQSGQLLSPYRQDQLKAWLAFEPHAVAFSAKQLEKQSQHKLILNNR